MNIFVRSLSLSLSRLQSFSQQASGNTSEKEREREGAQLGESQLDRDGEASALLCGTQCAQKVYDGAAEQTCLYSVN